MPVTHMELENFKSYAGLQTIGPFHDFTCVIGPNGSGKSNLMDAISFVLGVQSRDLRSSQMRDLIFRPPGAAAKKIDRKLKASATIVYKDAETGEETRFGRSISSDGVGQYRVNGEPVMFKKYEEKLSEIGVLLKARNFLVFQGDVESIARKTPKQLVEMFENISNSSELSPSYETALKAKEEAESATVFSYNKQKGFKSERKALKEQKEEAEKFHSMLERKAELQTEYYLWQLFHIHADIGEREESADDLKIELDEKDEDAAEKAGLLKDAKKEASQARRKAAAAEKKRVKLAAEVDKVQPDVIKMEQEVKNLTKKVASDEKASAKVKKEREAHGEKLAEIEAEIEEYTEKERALQEEYEEIKNTQGGEGGITS
eukprot:CAMPEP_0113557096 /NCGR_PEP_ID=MMETSP0015_2-20120614/17604_1 /TAXON_ID=2838 /ORGANISM="Odontella" /LENGTH=374 /DNA_ID=CAMNT_0000458489 /DNA_START=554 /DNA_END=1675 /DNA_ORIENTATION=- /assembly_acc=CAM_ASM_000160